jgi:putative transposase
VRARLAPLIPVAFPGGRPRKIDMQTAMNAIPYSLRTGCPASSFPPRSMVYNMFRKFQRDGIWPSWFSTDTPAPPMARADLG